LAIVLACFRNNKIEVASPPSRSSPAVICPSIPLRLTTHDFPQSPPISYGSKKNLKTLDSIMTLAGFKDGEVTEADRETERATRMQASGEKTEDRIKKLVRCVLARQSTME